MAIFRPKPRNFLFLQRRKAFFLSRISQKTFSWSKLPKKKSWKDGHFGLKTWVNPLGKMSIFRLSELLVFYSVERRFFVLEYRKRHHPGQNCLKKKVGKMAIFGPKQWEKCQFFSFLDFFFLQGRKAFFRSRISQKTFSWPKYPKKKSWKNGHFWTKTMG